MTIFAVLWQLFLNISLNEAHKNAGYLFSDSSMNDRNQRKNSIKFFLGSIRFRVYFCFDLFIRPVGALLMTTESTES